MDSKKKTPEIDGLPLEFYKTFWDDLAPCLIASLNYAYEAGTLSVSQKSDQPKSDQPNTKKGR